MLTGCAAVRINTANEQMSGEGQTWMRVSPPVTFSMGVSPVSTGLQSIPAWFSVGQS